MIIIMHRYKDKEKIIKRKISAVISKRQRDKMSRQYWKNMTAPRRRNFIMKKRRKKRRRILSGKGKGNCDKYKQININ